MRLGMTIVNTSTIIKDKAKEICASNEEDGVVQWGKAHA